MNKKILLIITLCTVLIPVRAIVISKTITIQEAGTLRGMLGQEVNTVQVLIIKGELNETDYLFLKETCATKELYCIDLREAVQVGFERNDRITRSFFSGWIGLREILLPNSVTEMEPEVFRNNTTLEGVSLPRPLLTIPPYTFSGCTSLVGVDAPSSIWTIEKYAFQDCIQMLNWNRLPEELREIGEYAFAGCGSSWINLGSTPKLEKIGGFAFAGCRDMVAIEIPETVTEIGESAFIFCESLRTLILPDAIKKIEKNAFTGCSRLLSVVLPSELEVLEPNIFSNCASLKEIRFPEKLIEIGAEAFSGCEALDTVVFPESLKIIGRKAFQECCRMASVVLPPSLEYIASGAFGSCLTSVQSLCPVPPICEPGAIENKDALVIVPDGSLEAYQKAEGWKDFMNMYEVSSVSSLSMPSENNFSVVGGKKEIRITNAGSLFPVTIYTLQGTIQKNISVPRGEIRISLPEGIYMIKKEGTIRKVIVR